MRTRALAVVGLILLLAAGAGCGKSSNDTPEATKLTVLGAASLTDVFPEIGAKFTKANPGVTFAFSFAGTDQLAAQIEQGAPADVFAGASTKYGDQLAGENLIDDAAVFCTNQLVVITPAANPGGIDTLEDLATEPIKLVIGSETVPIGSYTRTVLTNLDAVYGAGYSDKVLANVVSNEDSVTTILTKVQSGEADAGFVYITDSMAAGSDLKTLTLPDEAQAVAQYPIAVVKGGEQTKVAQQFVDYVMSSPAQEFLMRAGFGPPPSS